jgi:hypothetical protein
VASLSKIIASGETLAEEEALRWARDRGIFSCRSIGFLRSRAGGKMLPRALDMLLQNVTDSDATLLVSIGPELGPQQKKAIEFLGATKKPFLHLWASIPQPGRLVQRFLELHKVEVLNVVGSPKDDEEATGTFIRSVFDTMIPSTHL